MIKNANRVPKKQWNRWSIGARAIFNRCYDYFMDHQETLNHPKAPKLPPQQWKTVAWNAAWIAADACDESIPTEII